MTILEYLPNCDDFVMSRKSVESMENRHIKMKLERDFEGSFGKGLTTNLSPKK